MGLSQIQLEAFQAVAKTGSFTKAANLLNLTQSALSHRIRNLESDLRTTLFVRHSSGIQLTELGTRLLQYCRVQIQAEEEFLREVLPKQTSNQQRQRLLSGTLRIGGVSTLVRSVIIPSIAKLMRSNPEIRLELFSRELSELPRLITSGQVDFLVSCGRISAPGLEEAVLGFEEYVLVEPMRKGADADSFLDHDSEDQTTHDFFKLNGRKNLLLKRSFMDDIYGLLDGVAAGFGRAVAPVHLVKERKDINVAEGYKAMRLPVYLYQLKQPYYTNLHSSVFKELLTHAPLRLQDRG